jgi:hypothetical protein
MGRSLSIHFTSCIALELNTTLFTIINPYFDGNCIKRRITIIRFIFCSILVAVVFLCRCATRLVLENRKTRVKILFVPYYFFIMNLSVVLGFFRYVKNSQSVNWERSKERHNW